MGSDAINLRDQLAVLRRRWRWLAVCGAAGLLVALGVSLLQPTQYRSSTNLEISPNSASQTATNGIVMQPAEIATQMQVLQSTPVATRVIDRLKLDTTASQLLDTVSAAQETDTRVITVTAMQPTPERAQAVAAAFAEEYLSFRDEQASQQTEDALSALQDQAIATREQLAKVERRIPRTTGTELAQLRSQQQALLVELTQILSDQATAASNSPGALGGGGQVLVPAPLPGSPSEPKPLRSSMLGFFLGLLFGVVIAFVRDHFDDAVRDDARLREAIAPRPILGRIPHWTRAGSGRLATVLDPSSPVSEAYRALGTNIRFLLAVIIERDPAPPRTGSELTKASQRAPTKGAGKLLLVTSATEAEGKTSLASNLAVVAAQFGLRVVLVDADLRSPQLSGVFGLGHPPGLTDLLASDHDVSDYLITVESLSVLAGGSVAPNPAELLASPRMRELLNTLAAQADLVVIDTPPVTKVADALELVSSCDLVILSARHAHTRLRALHDAIERISQVGGEVAGAVYVDIPLRSGPDSYGYGQNYGSDETPPTQTPDSGKS